MATKAKESEAPIEERPDAAAPDGPLLDLSDDAVKKMIKAGKKRGFVTMDKLNSMLSADDVTSEQIEDMMSMLSDMGINVVESDEDGEAEDNAETSESTEVASPGRTQVATTTKKEAGDRTDDPVRMYLREMGSVELLSREGEIAIAKRIEAGRETMIAGLCESPLSFQAIIIWRDELNDGNIMLREIVDLEATYAGPEAKTPTPPPPSADGTTPQPIRTPQPGARAPGEEEEEEDDDLENNLSLAAMEAEIKPQVMEIFDQIADAYRRLRKLQDQQVENRLAAQGTLSPSQERSYKKLKEELITAVKSLSLNQNRIDALVAQLYDINKRLVGNEGRLLRLAESHGVKRDEFLREYQGSELDPNWTRHIANLSEIGRAHV